MLPPYSYSCNTIPRTEVLYAYEYSYYEYQVQLQMQCFFTQTKSRTRTVQNSELLFFFSLYVCFSAQTSISASCPIL